MGSPRRRLRSLPLRRPPPTCPPSPSGCGSRPSTPRPTGRRSTPSSGRASTTGATASASISSRPRSTRRASASRCTSTSTSTCATALPLLAGGRGTWIYGTADYLGGYPSRSFQYSQAAQTLNGSIAIQQPDGSILAEPVDPARSSMVIVHEYDATPEDIPAGLALTTATQLHHRFVQEYQGGIPWELMYFDIGNGAQLQLLVQAYKDTEDGTIDNAGGVFSVPTYRVMGTVRLPNGQSAQVDDRLLVEHLEYREIVGRVPTTFVAITGQWTQAWRLRVGFPGGTATAGDGTTVDIPPFDLGIEPFADTSRHLRRRQRRRSQPAGRPADLRHVGQVPGRRVRLVGADRELDGPDRSGPVVHGRRRPRGAEALPEEAAVVGAQDGNGLPLTPPGENPPLPDPTTPPEGCAAGVGQPATPAPSPPPTRAASAATPPRPAAGPSPSSGPAATRSSCTASPAPAGTAAGSSNPVTSCTPRPATAPT